MSEITYFSQNPYYFPPQWMVGFASPKHLFTNLAANTVLRRTAANAPHLEKFTYCRSTYFPIIVV